MEMMHMLGKRSTSELYPILHAMFLIVTDSESCRCGDLPCTVLESSKEQHHFIWSQPNPIFSQGLSIFPFSLFVLKTVSCPGWPGAYCVDKAGLELRDPLASPSKTARTAGVGCYAQLS